MTICAGFQHYYSGRQEDMAGNCYSLTYGDERRFNSLTLGMRPFETWHYLVDSGPGTTGLFLSEPLPLPRKKD
jgi:hypothetical protein